MPNTIFLQFGSFTPINVYFPRKTPEGSLEIDDNEVDGCNLVSHKKQKHQAVLRIRLPKTRAVRSDVNQLQPSKSVKPCTSQKINGSLSQRVRRPITLDEFFPKKFFYDSQIGATHVVSSTDETKESKRKNHATITQEHQATGNVAPCCATITFTDDELLLGSKLHNRPLFVVGSIREQHLNRILIDGGSAVNSMPKVVLKKLEFSIDELSKNNLMIQDAKTSYNLLLRRPWVHENRVVSSILHQCMKYMKDGEVVKIDADINPFTETESYFAGAKFYLDSRRSNIEEHVEADSIDLKDSKVQWVAINMSKKRTEEVSIKLSPSK
ncbi:hypothetical protein MTR67_044720 [Solanum verrucosum]|uniref:Uncharacterized protein n=1 Tax=Solanum verrucosum TaxID=315347 RepID=A0AAF0ZVX5_SOLVR|nr:hypothetical protein MTR67_044720 [Solanum verrucosum]